MVLARLTVNFSGRVRRATYHGREYLVAQMTLINPGVLNGSKGPLLYPPDEIARNAGQWDGVPITVYHPHKLGQPVSAQEPGIWDRQGVGVVRNTKVNGKLRAEGWFDAERTRRVNPTVYNKLMANEPIELSTGLFTDNEERSGVYHGRQYTAVARNYRADHLAVLPDQLGACSVADGCGVLVNADGLRHKLDALLSNAWREGEHPRHGGKFSSKGESSRGNDAQRAFPHMAHLLNGARLHATGLSKQEARAEAMRLREQGLFASGFQDPKGGRGKQWMITIPENTPSLNYANNARAGDMTLRDKLSVLVGNADQILDGTDAEERKALAAHGDLDAEDACEGEENCSQPLRNLLKGLLSNDSKEQKESEDEDTVELKTDRPQGKDPKDADEAAGAHNLFPDDSESSLKDDDLEASDEYGDDWQDHLDDAEEENKDTEVKLNTLLQNKLNLLVGNWGGPPQDGGAPPMPPVAGPPALGGLNAPKVPPQAGPPPDPAAWLAKQIMVLVAKFQEMSGGGAKPQGPPPQMMKPSGGPPPGNA